MLNIQGDSRKYEHFIADWFLSSLALQWLRQFVVGLSRLKTVFDSSSVYVGFLI